jgi:hypothetical protein
MQAMLGHPVRVEARVGAREKLRIVGWQRGERSSKVVGGANGGQRRVTKLLGRVRKRSRGGNIGPGVCRGGCSVAVWPTGARG